MRKPPLLVLPPPKLPMTLAPLPPFPCLPPVVKKPATTKKKAAQHHQDSKDTALKKQDSASEAPTSKKAVPGSNGSASKKAKQESTASAPGNATQDLNASTSKKATRALTTSATKAHVKEAAPKKQASAPAVKAQQNGAKSSSPALQFVTKFKADGTTVDVEVDPVEAVPGSPLTEILDDESDLDAGVRLDPDDSMYRGHNSKNRVETPPPLYHSDSRVLQEAEATEEPSLGLLQAYCINQI
ncbi:hypothetical protein NMY22_g14657 [Coprinellus aureogranulatus]|nr:hypothetical protein NMY22_g14657 [Coprinellus aureogranulatus]